MTDPIIDAHHHIWRRADQPWLQGPTVPRIFGEYDAIKRDYSIDEFKEDIAETGVVKSVYVQTNWDKNRAVEEVQWVQEIAETTGWPHAIVGFADFDSDDVGETLAAQAQFPLMRGVRQQLHWHENPQYRFAPQPDQMNTSRFRRNFAKLEDYDWLFELQIFADQTVEGVSFAKAFPNMTFVLEHAGMPEDRSNEGRRKWRDGIRRLADLPNMYTKLSGLGTFIRRNDPSHISEIAEETIEIFGAERCMWGSNFPIEKLWTDYPAIVSAARGAVANLSASERQAVLHDTAARLYHL
jgi:predicted TIM-barrel fold metal-dependent hydrolase